jgi:hypothetical protein
MTTTTSTYRVSINYKDKVILLSKPLETCEYFKHNASYIDGTYTISNELVEVHKDTKNYRESHYIKNYKIAKILFNNLKTTKKDYFFYNSMEN